MNLGNFLKVVPYRPNRGSDKTEEKEDERELFHAAAFRRLIAYVYLAATGFDFVGF